MYLIKLEVPLNTRKAVELMANAQKMHQMLTGLFGQTRREQNLLYCSNTLQGKLQIYAYAQDPPGEIPPEICLVGFRDLKAWLAGMQEGDVWHFCLHAMPSKKVYRSQRDQNSQRRMLRVQEERLCWLQRKAEQNGFSIVQVEELSQSHQIARRPKEKGGVLHLDAYCYQGILEITDRKLFCKGVQSGIGPGKAYGLGMLLLKKP